MKISIEKRKTGTSISLKTGKVSDAIHEFLIIEDAEIHSDFNYPYLCFKDSMYNTIQIKHDRKSDESITFAVHFKNCEFKERLSDQLKFKMCHFENCEFEEHFYKNDFTFCKFTNCCPYHDLHFKMCELSSVSFEKNTYCQFTFCELESLKYKDDCSGFYTNCTLDHKTVNS